jgi:IS5 family transposase
MKAHIGADADSALVHSVTTTPANAHDVTQAHALLHGEEMDVFGDSGYRGVDKRQEVRAQPAEVNGHVDEAWVMVAAKVMKEVTQ